MTNYTVTVTDANNTNSNQSFNLTVNSVLTTTVAIASIALPVNQVVTSFTPVTAAGGTTPYVYTVSPTLPSGLSLNASLGSIGGTPTVVSAAANYTVTVTDASNTASGKIFNLAVNPGWVTASPLSLVYNSERSGISTSLSATGANSYALVSGTLPAGLSLASNGAITGTATAVTTNATASFTVSATDTTTGTTANKAFMWTISAPITQIVTSSSSFVVPASTYVTTATLKVLLIGGGGGGAGTNNPSANTPGAGSGTAVENLAYASAPGASIAIQIGAGGLGGASSAGQVPGFPGATTTFGTINGVGGGGGGGGTTPAGGQSGGTLYGSQGNTCGGAGGGVNYTSSTFGVTLGIGGPSGGCGPYPTGSGNGGGGTGNGIAGPGITGFLGAVYVMY